MTENVEKKTLFTIQLLKVTIQVFNYTVTSIVAKNSKTLKKISGIFFSPIPDFLIFFQSLFFSG